MTMFLAKKHVKKILEMYFRDYPRNIRKYILEPFFDKSKVVTCLIYEGRNMLLETRLQIYFRKYSHMQLHTNFWQK